MATQPRMRLGHNKISVARYNCYVHRMSHWCAKPCVHYIYVGGMHHRNICTTRCQLSMFHNQR
eukprot:3633553-Prorocentrum_lima.AAC.1